MPLAPPPCFIFPYTFCRCEIVGVYKLSRCNDYRNNDIPQTLPVDAYSPPTPRPRPWALNPALLLACTHPTRTDRSKATDLLPEHAFLLQGTSHKGLTFRPSRDRGRLPHGGRNCCDFHDPGGRIFYARELLRPAARRCARFPAWALGGFWEGFRRPCSAPSAGC